MNNSLKMITTDSNTRLHRIFFLAQLRQFYGIVIRDNENIKALSKTWCVSERTVKRDISDAEKIQNFT